MFVRFHYNVVVILVADKDQLWLTFVSVYKCLRNQGPINFVNLVIGIKMSKIDYSDLQIIIRSLYPYKIG